MRAGHFVFLIAAMVLGAAMQGRAADLRPPVKAPPLVQDSGVFWIEGEYLYWSAKGDRLPALVTTSPSGTPFVQAGILGLPTTTVLFGNSEVNDGWRSGGRLKGGYWFDRARTNGIEAHFFALADATTKFSAASDGSVILAQPITNAQTGAGDAVFFSAPGVVSGSLLANERTGLFGGGIAWRRNLCSGCFGDRLEAVIGYRFIRLSDRFDVATNTFALSGLAAGAISATADQFSTVNTFHGADLGLRGRFVRGPWSLDWATNVAVGVNVNDISVSGLSSVSQGGLQTGTVGGFLALPTNIGRFSQNRLAVAPELDLNLGYQITPQLRAFAGYNLLYLTGVVRPGETIDTTINVTQLNGGPLAGPARPLPQFRTTDYWAQGLNAGVALTF